MDRGAWQATDNEVLESDIDREPDTSEHCRDIRKGREIQGSAMVMFHRAQQSGGDRGAEARGDSGYLTLAESH